MLNSKSGTCGLTNGLLVSNHIQSRYALCYHLQTDEKTTQINIEDLYFISVEFTQGREGHK